MAVFYIAEYESMVRETYLGEMIQAPLEPPIVEQTLAVGTVIASLPFGPSTRFIRVHTDAICSRKIGTNPVAATTHARMAAGATEYLAVKPGHRISVISNT